MPDIHLPKFGFKGKKPKAEVDADIPTAKLEGPDIDLNVDAPSLDIDIEKPGKFDLSMPDVSLPKFGFKGKSPKVDMTCPDADIGMPEVDVKVATPAVGA